MPAPCSPLVAARLFAAAAGLASTGFVASGCVWAVVLFGSSVVSPPAAAFFDAPAPKVDCSKRENRSKPQCKKSQIGPTLVPATTLASRPDAAVISRQDHDQVFFAAYGLARAGQYAAALAILATADQSDPRVLNYQGFATRKLGHVDAALPFYRRALAIDPDYVLARAYMGEAYLQKGQSDAARDQLAEIERRCSRACAEYVDLAMQIESHHKVVGGG